MDTERASGLSPVEPPGDRARGMDEARAFFPAAPPFLELSRARVLGMSGFALLAVAAIEFERHKAPCSF